MSDEKRDILKRIRDIEKYCNTIPQWLNRIERLEWDILIHKSITHVNIDKIIAEFKKEREQ